MICSICNSATVPTVDQAIEDGWNPSWWHGDDCFEPNCPSCTAKFLQIAEDGEMELCPPVTVIKRFFRSLWKRLTRQTQYLSVRQQAMAVMQFDMFFP